MKRVVFASLVLFASASLLSADYYVVESNGDAYPVQKAAKGYERISERPSFTSSFNPGYVDTVYYFDPDVGGWYYPNRDSNTVVTFLFNSEYACSLIAVGIHFYSEGYAELYVWEGPDPIPSTTAELETELNATWDYDTLTNNWDSWPTKLYGPELIGSTEPGELTERTCWVDLAPNLDIGTSAVYVGYRIVTHYNPAGTPYGGKPWTLSDNWIDPGGNPPRFAPCRSWMYREQPGAATDNQWVEYGDITGDWEFFFVIDIYVNAPPDVKAFDQVRGSYDTGAKVVTADIADFGVPADSSGVAEAWLLYHLNDNPATLDSLAMSLVSGTAEDGTWEATIPGQPAVTKVTYYFHATDLQGLSTSTEANAHVYYIRAGTPGNMLLMLESDAYYGGDYSHDAVRSVAGRVDLWDEAEYGTPDSTVFDYYMPGGKVPGQGIIFWYAWSGFLFAAEAEFLSDFLDEGGKLFITSQDLPAGGFGLSPDYTDWVAPAGHFVHDYLKAYEGYDDYYGVAPRDDTTFTQYGVPGDPITGSANLAEILAYPYGFGGPGSNYAGTFDLLDGAAVPILYGPLGEVMAYRYEDAGGYKIVFIYWPCNYIAYLDLSDWDTEAQDTLIHNTLTWFGYVGVYEEEAEQAGFRCALHAALPNPVTDVARIGYSLSSPRNVSLKVYDITGRLVKTLVDERVEAGEHFVEWNLRDDSSGEVAAGVYFYRLEAESFQNTQKLIVVR